MRERVRVGATGSSAGSRGDERTTTRRDATKKERRVWVGFHRTTAPSTKRATDEK